MKHARKGQLATAALASAAALISGCGGNHYSPLDNARTSVASAPRSALPPEVVVLAQEAAPVIGLEKIDAEFQPLTVRPNNPPAPPRIQTGWIPLGEWTIRNDLGPVERIPGTPPTFRFATGERWGKITSGSRLGYWNGVAVWLGFAPQLVNGEPQIHSLDAEKLFKPLRAPRESFPLVNRTIVLDPGHGGSDGGTRDAHHRLEKHYALDWALRTERLLTNAGWRVFLTRRTDVDVPLAERTAYADSVNADIFISLHFNSTGAQTQPSGIETYCLTPYGMPSTLARGYADDSASIFPNNAHDAANAHWAHRFQSALLAHTGQHDAGVKRARFMSVLRYQNRPAVLIEGGFLSNPAEAAKIASAEYREKLARAILQAIQ